MLRARGVNAVDVRPALLAAKQQGEVYSRGDTHWNDRGAYIAARAVAAALRDAGVRDAVVPSGSHVAEMRGDLLNISGVGAWIRITSS